MLIQLMLLILFLFLFPIRMTMSLLPSAADVNHSLLCSVVQWPSACNRGWGLLVLGSWGCWRVEGVAMWWGQNRETPNRRVNDL